MIAKMGLMIPAIWFFVMGAFIFLGAETAVHEITALVSLAIGAIFLSGALIVSVLLEIKESMQKSASQPIGQTTQANPLT